MEFVAELTSWSLKWKDGVWQDGSLKAFRGVPPSQDPQTAHHSHFAHNCTFLFQPSIYKDEASNAEHHDACPLLLNPKKVRFCQPNLLHCPSLCDFPSPPWLPQVVPAWESNSLYIYRCNTHGGVHSNYLLQLSPLSSGLFSSKHANSICCQPTQCPQLTQVLW